MSMSRSAAQLLLLDDPQERSAFGRPHSPAAPAGPADPATVWESQEVLEGMDCAASALTNEHPLRAVPGVLQADVSAATRRARVLWQPGLGRPSQWLQGGHQAGSRAMPAGDALTREQCLRARRQRLPRLL